MTLSAMSTVEKNWFLALGYLVESEVRIVGGKEKRYQKKTPLSYVLAPAPDNAGGNG